MVLSEEDKILITNL